MFPVTRTSQIYFLSLWHQMPNAQGNCTTHTGVTLGDVQVRQTDHLINQTINYKNKTSMRLSNLISQDESHNKTGCEQKIRKNTHRTFRNVRFGVSPRPERKFHLFIYLFISNYVCVKQLAFGFCENPQTYPNGAKLNWIFSTDSMPSWFNWHFPTGDTPVTQIRPHSWVLNFFDWYLTATEDKLKLLQLTSLIHTFAYPCLRLSAYQLSLTWTASVSPLPPPSFSVSFQLLNLAIFATGSPSLSLLQLGGFWK